MPRAASRPRQLPIALASGSVLTHGGGFAVLPLHAAASKTGQILIARDTIPLPDVLQQDHGRGGVLWGPYLGATAKALYDVVASTPGR